MTGELGLGSCIFLGLMLLISLIAIGVTNTGEPSLTEYPSIWAEGDQFDRASLIYHTIEFALALLGVLATLAVAWHGYHHGLTPVSIGLLVAIVAVSGVAIDLVSRRDVAMEEQRAHDYNTGAFANIRAEIASGDITNACQLVYAPDFSDAEMTACRTGIEQHESDDERFEMLADLTRGGIYRQGEASGQNIPAIPPAQQVWYIEQFQSLSWKLYTPREAHELDYVSDNLVSFAGSTWTADAKRAFWNVTDRELTARMADYALQPETKEAAQKLRQLLDTHKQ